MAEEKVCTIVNGQFSYILEVDGESIAFNGSSSAEYFKEHYRKLGYKIHLYKESYAK